MSCDSQAEAATIDSAIEALGDDMGDLLAKLHEMEASDGRPIYRRVSELSQEIEEAMNRGFTRAQIVRGLSELGIEISVATLSKYLFRIRRLSAAGDLTVPLEKQGAPDLSIGV